ncbi:MAG: sulfatase-like hydrolase/transferase [Phycisphaerales bacterium]|nr:sulfatase-like hydrolase/transferase [Phycisphaerales bacterium]
MLRHNTMLAALALNCSFVVSALAQDGPNLIFILTDDQGVESIDGPYWSNAMGCTTPTLAALARQGVSFTNCRVNPNCSPTRACLMTGRSALDTGVNGVLTRYASDVIGNPCHESAGPLTGIEARVTNRLALQTQEWTIGEVLQNMGYYTILVDKWHLGYDEFDEERGMRPELQGFNEVFDWMDLIEGVYRICQGYPDTFYADHHMVDAAEFAVAAAGRRAPGQKYALFFHTITPHRRHSDNPDNPTAGYNWWAIEDDVNLIPVTRNLTLTDPAEGGQVVRFLQNVEAMDSVIRRDLLLPLGIIENIENEWPYIEESDTVVFFTSDNGTDPDVTSQRYGTWRGAKNTLYEGGINVPLFVMGEGISDDPNLPNTVDTRQISHVDFFDTIADIIEAPEAIRANPHGNFPRRGASFACNIGWSDRAGADQ